MTSVSYNALISHCAAGHRHSPTAPLSCILGGQEQFLAAIGAHVACKELGSVLRPSVPLERHWFVMAQVFPASYKGLS